jgi:hypothetical protein
MWEDRLGKGIRELGPSWVPKEPGIIDGERKPGSGLNALFELFWIHAGGTFVLTLSRY